MIFKNVIIKERNNIQPVDSFLKKPGIVSWILSRIIIPMANKKKKGGKKKKK